MLQVLRLIRPKEFRQLKENRFTERSVGVYYTFNTYRDDLSYLMEIQDVIQKEHPEITPKDMHVWRTRPDETRQHACMLVIQVSVKPEYVLQNFKQYSVL